MKSFERFLSLLPKDFPPRSTVHGYFVWWHCDGVLDRIHHALYVECREQAQREASPTACIIDSQSVKSAFDEDTGKTLWQFKTGSSVNATAITYTHKGQQYVSIASGLGGQLAGRVAGAKVPRGGSVWTFALMPE